MRQMVVATVIGCALVSACVRLGFDTTRSSDGAGREAGMGPVVDAGSVGAGDGSRADRAAVTDATEHGDDGGAVVTSCAGAADFTPCVVDTTPTEGVDREYDVCMGGVCVSPGCGDLSCNTSGPSFPLPDTNVRLCYDHASQITCPGAAGASACAAAPFCGQDAQYGWDVTHSSAGRLTRSVSVAGQPVVVDNLVGLMWAGCAGGLSGNDCSSGALTTMVWSDAFAYCEGLQWGGHADWMLPDGYMLTSLVDWSRHDPAVNPAAFPNLPISVFWAAQKSSSSTASALTVHLRVGTMATYFTGSRWHALCVRRTAPPASSAVRFSRAAPIADEPVVVDSVTGLMWQGCDVGARGADCTLDACARITWEAALSACEGLAWGGYDDWRVANVIEILSIVNSRLPSPTIDALAFPRSCGSNSWSSTSRSDDTQFAWYASTSTATTSSRLKTQTAYVRCVRDP